MTVREQAINEIQRAPEEFVREALDFLRRLLAQATAERMGTARASEATLAKDWETPDEDEAWASL
ncbi:MAG TPA: DUF2281 domain-containing protein [Polyangia bacterium]|jgi:hypothetical protein